MGNCNSVNCSDGKIEKVGKMAKKEENEETEETPVVEIHINCPSNRDSRQSQSKLKQDTGTVETISSSVQVRDFDYVSEQSLSDTSPFLSEDEYDVGPSQDREEDFSFEVRGKSCLPRNMTVTGLGQQNNIHSCELAPVESPACCSSWNGSQLQRQGNGNGESSGLHRPTKISLPLPRPSLWQQVYSKTLKKREQLADKKLNGKTQCHTKKENEADSLEEAIRARSIGLINKVKKSMRLKEAQDLNSGPAALPPDEAIARRFGVDVEDCRDSGSNNSSSRASSRLSSAASRHSSITSDRDLEETLESANNGQNGGKKSRKLFKLKHNKVAPL